MNELRAMIKNARVYYGMAAYYAGHRGTSHDLHHEHRGAPRPA